ncbi:hypothetical protein H6F78_00130 [Coleofasciculus sp. FACHB-64]|uniref:hypothetical protein n=1 Tax=Cyanophyceae TaxID=3028117 RepID=UPI0016858969|nr:MULTISPECIES: hypothetical protein [unclassified Coleofasciculus]MBD1840865.1 hypothetical protein [Coleofasciculus sp. FACHB-501]MBD2044054.1 hypothetical protein [Coleofasciculus sp. FACHB-64]
MRRCDKQTCNIPLPSALVLSLKSKCQLALLLLRRSKVSTNWYGESALPKCRVSDRSEDEDGEDQLAADGGSLQAAVVITWKKLPLLVGSCM